ncbi:MAG TPA: hypothetical protein VJ483_03280, partial [Holophagaceae bacterium]|nr:hypothetical protein [Holophagaceae bacterium]
NPATTSSVLTFSVTNAAAPGTYTITITGVSGGLTRTTTTTLNISAFPDYSLGLSSPSLTVQNGLSTTDTVSITGINGFASSVTLSLTGAPAGLTATFAPNPATTTSIMTLTTTGAVVPGTYAMNVQGVGGSLTRTTALSVTVTDFSLSAPASITANIPAPASPNTSATGTITVNALSGFSGSATLSVSGLPTGVTLTSFTPNPTSTTSTLTLSIASTAVQGTTTVTVNGVSNGITRSTTFSLVLNGGFTLALAPNAMTLDIPASATNSASTSLSATAFAGFSGNVTLSTSGLPTGVTVAYATNPVATGSGTLVTVQTDATATPGSYTLTVNGVSGAQTASTTLSLTLQNTNFSLSATPNPVSLQVPAAGASASTSATTSISLTELGTGSGSATLGVSGLPAGVTGSFTGNLLTLAAAPGTPASGLTSFTVTGTRGIYTNTLSVGLDLSPAADFSLGAAPNPLNIQIPEPSLSNSGGATVTVTPVNGFANTITFSASGLPAGTSALFTPASATTSSTFTVTVNPSATPGSYPITLSGTDGNITRTTSLTLNLSASATFSLSLTGGIIATLPGGGGSDTVTITPANGFSNAVTLSLVSPPAGITLTSFSPNPATIGGGYTSTVTLAVAGTVAAGDYPITIQGTDGFVTSTVTETVRVQSYAITLDVPPTASALPIIHRGNAPGYVDTVNVTVTALNGYAGTVGLSIPDLAGTSTNPATVAYTWSSVPNSTSVSVGGANPTSVTVPLTVAINGNQDGDMIPGIFTSTLTSNDGTTTFTNPVTDIEEDFYVPFTQATVVTSASANFSVPVSIFREPTGSLFDEDVVLSASALGPWSTATFGSGTGDLGTTGTTDTLNLATGSGGPVAPGTYYLTLTGTSSPSGLVRSANVAITVAGISLSVDTPRFTFYGPQTSMTASGNLTVTPDPTGYSGSVNLSGTTFNGFNWTFGTTPLAVSSPTPVGTSYTLNGSFISTPLGAGVYDDVLTADDGAGSAPTQVVETVVEDFSVADSAAVATASSGYTGTVALTLTRLPAQFPYDGDVTFTASDKNGLFTYSFAPATLTNPGTGTVMSFTPAPTAVFTAGDVIFVNVVATDAVHGVTHTANVTLTIADFLVQPTPATFTVYGSQILNLSGNLAVPMAAGIGPVTLSATNANGITYGFGANPISPAANPEQTATTFTATTSGIVGPGVYTDTISGTDGTELHSANVTITLYDFTITGITSVSMSGSSPTTSFSTVTINRTPVVGGPTYPNDISMFESADTSTLPGQFSVFITALPSIPAGQSTGTLQIVPNFATIPAGTYTFDITVYDSLGGLQHVGTLTVTVT